MPQNDIDDLTRWVSLGCARSSSRTSTVTSGTGKPRSIATRAGSDGNDQRPEQESAEEIDDLNRWLLKVLAN